MNPTPGPWRVLAAVADPVATITSIRVADPLKALFEQGGGELRLSPLHDVPGAALDWADILVVQRGITSRHLALMRNASELGKAVIYDIDDLLTEPAGHLMHYQGLKRHEPWVRASLAAADLVTVSTPRLAGMLGLAAEKFHVVPNTVFRPAGGQSPRYPLPDQVDGSPVTVLAASSDQVAGATAWQALREVQALLGGRLQVLAVGPAADDLARAGVQHERVPMMPRDAFLRWAHEAPNPVAVIPLDDSRFSAGKSAVKWFDYALAGVPTLASAVGPYLDNIENNRTGWLVGPDTADWHAALLAVLHDAPSRLRVAAAAREHVGLHHHGALMSESWGEALHRATKAAQQRKPLGAAPRWLTGMRRVAYDLQLGVRRWNRGRLDKRS